jgi:hypothetical protein
MGDGGSRCYDSSYPPAPRPPPGSEVVPGIAPYKEGHQEDIEEEERFITFQTRPFSESYSQGQFSAEEIR